jgi:hypothetical protein
MARGCPVFEIGIKTRDHVQFTLALKSNSLWLPRCGKRPLERLRKMAGSLDKGHPFLMSRMSASRPSQTHN